MIMRQVRVSDFPIARTGPEGFSEFSKNEKHINLARIRAEAATLLPH